MVEAGQSLIILAARDSKGKLRVTLLRKFPFPYWSQAFDSPFLAEMNSNSSGRDIAIAAGDTSAQYGVTNGCSGVERSKLKISNPDIVDRPQKGMRFDV